MIGRLPQNDLTITSVQIESAPGAVEANAAAARLAADRAAELGADLVVLPELHLPGYELGPLGDSTSGRSILIDSEGYADDARLDPLRAARVPIVVGAAVRRPEGLFNALLLAERGGMVRCAYLKRHLWHDESAVFERGPAARPAIVDVRGWPVAFGICYDFSFPEHARQAAVAGALAYVCPSAFVVSAWPRAHTYLAARALENTIYSVFCNAIGGPPDRLSGGNSAAYGPMGEQLTAVGADPAELRLVLDSRSIREARQLLRMLEEHREDEAR